MRYLSEESSIHPWGKEFTAMELASTKVMRWGCPRHSSGKPGDAKMSVEEKETQGQRSEGRQRQFGFLI